MERERITGRMYSREHHGRGWVVRLLLLCLIQHLPAAFGTDLFVAVSPGATATLPCDGPAVNDTNEVEVVWESKGMTVSSFKNGTLCEHPDFVNRTQLGSIQQNNFSLVINDARLQDGGWYKCLINGAITQWNHLSVGGGRKQRDAETSSKGNLVCKPYEDKDKEVPDENPPEIPSSGHPVNWTAVIALIAVIILIAVFAVIMANARKLSIRGNRQRNDV
ncbi:uncharacterized protein LOC125721833 isoform X1 [Brienomyrus brachyistius]|uniref:uncharacterized protein LOC125721833 isoform X1 n=1 Tax=Brienomyrus brachyistius TaxID=42636 RepID=UPI0020B344E4|nr:uncharacterized protein LOC125721833 isoform X1 [Brienomyrus brachyistius]